MLRLVAGRNSVRPTVMVMLLEETLSTCDLRNCHNPRSACFSLRILQPTPACVAAHHQSLFLVPSQSCSTSPHRLFCLIRTIARKLAKTTNTRRFAASHLAVTVTARWQLKSLFNVRVLHLTSFSPKLLLGVRVSHLPHFRRPTSLLQSCMLPGSGLGDLHRQLANYRGPCS